MTAPPHSSLTNTSTVGKMKFTHQFLNQKVKKNDLLANRGRPPITINTTAANLPIIYRKVEKQLTRNLILDARGIEPSNLKPPILNRHIQYRLYPPCPLGYNPQNPPQFVCVRQPGRQSGKEHEWFSDHPYQDYLSLDNLPDNLFLLEKGEDPLVNVKVPELADKYGHIVVNSYGRSLRFFSFLPRYIPQKVPGYVLEYWFRLDSRLEPSDIIDRMQPSTKCKNNDLPFGNAISMRRQRFRAVLSAKSVQPGRIDPCRNEVEYLSELTAEQILMNTTMWIAEGTLWIPRFHSNPMGITDWINTNLPVDYFFDRGPPIIPSPRVELAILLRHRLQTQALSLGLGRKEDNWTALSIEDQPSRWHDRGVRNRVTPSGKRKNYEREERDHYTDSNGKRKAVEIDGLTHDEWLNTNRLRLEGYKGPSPKPLRRTRSVNHDDSSTGGKSVGPGAFQGVVVNPAEQRVSRKDIARERRELFRDEAYMEDKESESKTDHVITSGGTSFGDFLLPQEGNMAMPDNFRRRTIFSQALEYVDLNDDAKNSATRRRDTGLPQPRFVPRDLVAVTSLPFPQAGQATAFHHRDSTTSTESRTSGFANGYAVNPAAGPARPPDVAFNMGTQKAPASAANSLIVFSTTFAQSIPTRTVVGLGDNDENSALLDAAILADGESTTDESGDESGREMVMSLQAALKLDSVTDEESEDEHAIGQARLRPRGQAAKK